MKRLITGARRTLRGQPRSLLFLPSSLVSFPWDAYVYVVCRPRMSFHSVNYYPLLTYFLIPQVLLVPILIPQPWQQRQAPVQFCDSMLHSSILCCFLDRVTIGEWLNRRRSQLDGREARAVYRVIAHCSNRGLA